MGILIYISFHPFFWLSLIQELIFWFYKVEIFNWNPQNRLMDLVSINKNPISVNKKDGKEQILREWQDFRKVYKKAPLSWKIYRFILEFICIFIGWNLFALFVHKFNQLWYPHADIGNLWNLILLLIIALIGIAGKLPIIIDSVQDWFKR